MKELSGKVDQARAAFGQREWAAARSFYTSADADHQLHPADLEAWGLAALLTGLSSGQKEGWGTRRVDVELGVALLATLGFLAWEWRCPAPLLNPRVFLHRGFAGAFAVALVYGACIFGTTYLLPLFVQTVQGYTATRAGMVLMPAGLVMSLITLLLAVAAVWLGFSTLRSGARR